jgi:hypothetical protein
MRTAVNPLATQLAKPLIALSAIFFEASNGAELQAQTLSATQHSVGQPIRVFLPQDHGAHFVSGGKAQTVQRELSSKARRNEAITQEDVVRLFEAFQAEPGSKPTGEYIRQYVREFPDSPVAIKSIVRFLANTETISATYKTFGKYLSSDDPEVVFYTLMAFARNNYGSERIELSVEELAPLLQHADSDVRAAAFLMGHTRQLPVAPGSILDLVQAQRWLGEKDRQGGDEVRLGQLLNAMLDNSISPPDLALPLLRTLSALNNQCPGYFDTLAARPEALELLSRELCKLIVSAREEVLQKELVNKETRTLVTFHQDTTLFREDDLREVFKNIGIEPMWIRYGAPETVVAGTARVNSQPFKARVMSFLQQASSDRTRKHLWFSGNHGSPDGLYYSSGEASVVLPALNQRRNLPHFAMSYSDVAEALLNGQKGKDSVQLDHCTLCLPNCFSGDFCTSLQEELIRCAEQRGQSIASFPWIVAGGQPGMLVDYTPHLRDISFRDKTSGEEVKINIPQLEIGGECVRELRFGSRSCHVRFRGTSMNFTGTSMTLSITKPDDVEVKYVPTEPQISSRLELGLLTRLGSAQSQCLTVGDFCEVQSELGAALSSELSSGTVLTRLLEARKRYEGVRNIYIAPVHETDPTLHTPYPLQLEDVLERVIERCKEQDNGFPSPQKFNRPQGRGGYIFEIGLTAQAGSGLV